MSVECWRYVQRQTEKEGNQRKRFKRLPAEYQRGYIENRPTKIEDKFHMGRRWRVWKEVHRRKGVK